MHPILLKLGPITVYSYGATVALGFGLAAFLIYERAEKFKLEKDKVIDLAILMLVSGVTSARIFYVFLNGAYYMAHPLEVFNLSKGGLVWYGAFLGALFALIAYIARNGLNFWTVADLIAPYVALAQGFGRVGCFLNGCCYGTTTNVSYPLAISYPAETALRHPTQLYSAVLLFLIFLALRGWQDRKNFNGEIFLGYCVFYSAKRFAIEFLRGDNGRVVFGLTISQGISVFVFALAFLIFIYKGIEWQKKSSNLK